MGVAFAPPLPPPKQGEGLMNRFPFRVQGPRDFVPNSSCASGSSNADESGKPDVRLGSLTKLILFFVVVDDMSVFKRSCDGLTLVREEESEIPQWS